MNRIAALLALPALLACAGCAGEERTPQPDPVAMERLVAQLDAEASAAAAVAAKAAPVDRLYGAVEKLDADRIDPSLATALIAR